MVTPETNILPRMPIVEISVVDVEVIEGPDRGNRVRVPAGVTRIGTGAGCGIRLSDPTVSRLHCELRIAPGSVTIADCGSTNGTRIEGIEVIEARLSESAQLQVGGSRLRVDLGGRQHVPLSARDSFGGVLGGSHEMRRVYAIMEKVAPTPTTVLIEGETGTGKELIARALHDASSRSTGPFVAVDCGAISETLIESELFGHVRGAFSGAIGDRIGLFEQARGGTIFLDEIGELPSGLQPKLLRALESREVRPVGGNVVRALDVRVVAATNRSLARSVNEGTFREDLYYRLAVFEIRVPPLRARRDDIPALARAFLKRITGDDRPLPPAVIATLMARSWPGNVRELRNFIERNAVLGWAAAQRGSPEWESVPVLEGLVAEDLPLKEAREAWNDRFEVLYVASVLRKSGGNISQAARLAGINRRNLHRLIAQHGIRGARDDDSSE